MSTAQAVVLYARISHKTDYRFYVYLDTVLCTPTIKRLIIARFHLPRRQTIFHTDMHDTTDPIDFLSNPDAILLAHHAGFDLGFLAIALTRRAP